jgi:hypothetical protein
LWTVLAGFVASLVPVQKGARAKNKRNKRTTTRKRTPVAPLRAPVVVAFLAVVAAAGLAWSGGLLLADRRYLRGNQLFASDHPDAASREFELALGFRDEYDMRHSYGFRIGDTGVALEDESYIDESRRVFSYLEDFPDVSAIRDYGRVMRQWSGIEPDADSEAEALYERAKELDQQNPALQEEAANVLDD